jgi:hypothetical protein
LKVQTEETDAAPFTGLLEHFMTELVSHLRPPEVYGIKVDNWFGPKWAGFSHKVLGAFGVASRDLVLPPFVPNRILSEIALKPDSSGELAEVPCPALHVDQPSTANASRKLAILFPEALLCWWSGNSAVHRRGSIMVYLPTPDGHTPWFIGFTETERWSPSLLRGVSASEVRAYLPDS